MKDLKMQEQNLQNVFTQQQSVLASSYASCMMVVRLILGAICTKNIMIAAAEFLFLSVLTLLVPLTIAADVLIIGNRMGETSLTELAQEGLLILTALFFASGVKRYPQSRGFLMLMAGFFVCVFIRELDGFLDKLLFHGSWVWLSLITAGGVIAYAKKCQETIFTPMSDFVRTRPYYFVLFGMIAIMVLSRTLGSGDLLWKRIITDGNCSLVKTVIQEGIEFFGYILICYGAFLFRYRRED